MEMTAMIWAMEHISQMQTFQCSVTTNPWKHHERNTDKTSSRIQEAFMQWDFNIKYKKGSEMPADYLSRKVVKAIDISNEDLAELQDQDKFCLSLKHCSKKLPAKKDTQN